MNEVRVLVTGGCGYIGSSLVPRLLSDERVTEIVVFDSLTASSPANLAGSITDQITFQRGDVREYGDVETAVRGADVIIHLAAITGASSTHERETGIFAINRAGSKNVLTAASKFDVESLVFASSCNNYGRAASTDIDKATLKDPLNLCPESKVTAEGLFTETTAEYGSNTTALHMSRNCGWTPGFRFSLGINHSALRGLTGRPLTVCGDGVNWRPFGRVRDTAGACHAALNPDQWSRPIHNLGSNSANHPIPEMAAIVSEGVESDLDVRYLKDKQPRPSYYINSDRLTDMRFKPEWTLREGTRHIASKTQNDANNVNYNHG